MPKLKVLALRKSLISSIFLGIILPMIVLRYLVIYDYLKIPRADLVYCMAFILCIFTFSFIIIFTYLLIRSHCSKCKKTWVYGFVDKDIVNTSSKNWDLNLLRLRFEFGNKVCIEDYNCTNCGHEYVVKVNRLFFNCGNKDAEI